MALFVSGLLTTTNAAGDIVDPYGGPGGGRGGQAPAPGVSGSGVYGQTGAAVSGGGGAAAGGGDYATTGPRGAASVGGGPGGPSGGGGGRFYSPQYNSASYSQQNGVSIPPNERDRYGNY